MLHQPYSKQKLVAGSKIIDSADVTEHNYIQFPASFWFCVIKYTNNMCKCQ
jgi:hypothetical protein